MAKVNIGEQTFVLPMATTILGSLLEDRPNFMALGWLTRVNFKPPMLGVAVNKGHGSHAAIVDKGEFNFLRTSGSIFCTAGLRPILCVTLSRICPRII